MLETSGLTYPNRIARLFFLAMEDVMGKNGLNAIVSLAGLDAYIDNLPPNNLERSFDFVYLAALSQALEDMYGARGGRGMALRIGRAAFARGLKNFGVMTGIADPAFQVLPIEQRIELGLDALTSIFNNFTDQASVLIDKDVVFEIITEYSPMAWGRSADRPVCHALVGIIQEGLRWTSDGYEFHVQEVSCRAAGAEACVFRVNKTPIGQL